MPLQTSKVTTACILDIVIHSDAFSPARNEHHFLAGNANGNCQTCEFECCICKKILTKQGKIRCELLFKI